MLRCDDLPLTVSNEHPYSLHYCEYVSGNTWCDIFKGKCQIYTKADIVKDLLTAKWVKTFT